MDGIVLVLFLVAAFVGGFASGLAGFAMGFVVSGVWLHILTPVQTTTLIAGYGLLTQGYGVWKLRHSLTWKMFAPFVIGGFFGVPLGTMLLTYVNPAYLRGGGGVLLIVYGIYGLVQPKFKPVPSNMPVGHWRRLRQRNCRWPDRSARLPHPHLVSNARLAEGRPARGLPACLARCHHRQRHIARSCRRHHGRRAAPLCDRSSGNARGLWTGFKLYGKLDDAAFRKLILVLLILAGLGLIIPSGV